MEKYIKYIITHWEILIRLAVALESFPSFFLVVPLPIL